MKKIKFLSDSKGKIAFFLLGAAILVGGCTINLGSSNQAVVAGVFKSVDAGNNWAAKNLFLYSGGTGNMSGINTVNLTFDPEDYNAIYLASDGQGMFYSYDGAQSWQKASQVGTGRIEAVAVDPKNKCVIYATFANTIEKSVDCNRTWKEVYIDTRADKTVTSLAVDSYNNLVIYAGNTAGDILKSVNGGVDWQVINRLNDRIVRILIDPNDTRIIYVATKSRGIFKTINGGIDWTDLGAGLKDYNGALDYKILIFDQSQKNSLLLAAKYGLIKTLDGGQTWTSIPLITPPGSTDIYSLTMDPKNNQIIYYTTATTFYKTSDGGKTWITKRLPSSALSVFLLSDPVNSNVIYMGLAAPAKK